MPSNSDTSDFIYTYQFDCNGFGWQLQVVIDFPFQSVSDMERISHFPHGQRRLFARKLIQKYAPGVYHNLTSTDICNSFARRLVDLFKTPLQVYWVRRQRDSVLIISGYDFKISVSVFEIIISATVSWFDLIHKTWKLWLSIFRVFQKVSLNPF